MATMQRKANELGITRRTLYLWKEQGCDIDQGVGSIREWAASVGKPGFYKRGVTGEDDAGLHDENWSLRYKRSQALLNEAKLQQEKEKFLAEKREELREEACRFLDDLIRELAKLELPREVAEKLNGAIDSCLDHCAKTN